MARRQSGLGQHQPRTAPGRGDGWRCRRPSHQFHAARGTESVGGLSVTRCRRSPPKAGVGSCEKIGRATARSHSRLGKLFRNKELFPDLERKSDRGKKPQVPARPAWPGATSFALAYLTIVKYDEAIGYRAHV